MNKGYYLRKNNLEQKEWRGKFRFKKCAKKYLEHLPFIDVLFKLKIKKRRKQKHQEDHYEIWRVEKFLRMVSTSIKTFPAGWLKIFFLFSRSFDKMFKLFNLGADSR